MNREDFDSNEEMYFYWWAKELQDEGYIKSIEAQPKPFDLSDSLVTSYYMQMKTKGKTVPEEILKGHIYTTDFKIVWNDKANGIFTTALHGDTRKKKGSSLQFIISHIDLDGSLYSHVEIKPIFDRNNMTRLVKINQKWVWDKYKEYVNIIIPIKHFNKTFTPNRFLLTDKSMKPRTINPKQLEVRTLKAFTNGK